MEGKKKNMKPETALKEHFRMIVDITDEQFSYIYSHFKLISYKKGQKIITTGDEVNHEYFVLSGCLKSYYLKSDNKMFILRFSMPGWWSSDYNALYYQIKATTILDCVIDSQVLSISSADREKLCGEFQEVEHFFRWRTNKDYVEAHLRLISFMNSAKHRYDELLKSHPQLFKIMPKQLIAAYLGISRETLSRLYNH
jgi:CRP-like cAMP-binding protein